MTFQEFCILWNVTGHERKALRIFLVALRVAATLKATL
jgi:hypothetical protein